MIFLNVNITGVLYNDVVHGYLSLGYTANGTCNDTDYSMQLEYKFYNLLTNRVSVTQGKNITADNPSDFWGGGYSHSALKLQLQNRSAEINPYRFSFSTQLQILLGNYLGSYHSAALNLTMAGLNKPVSAVINICFNQVNATSTVPV